MDFMDQAKTYVPHFKQSEKIKDLSHQLNWRIMGVRVHGVKDYFYLVDESLPGGGDPVTSILLEVLCDLFDSGIVPPARHVDLFLQFDNCGENKNKVLFGVLSVLVTFFWVKRGVKLYVEVNFLIVGHTHEDIDQLFKLIADHIRHKSLMTPKHFIACIEAWGRRPGAPPISAVYMDCIWKFNAFIKPKIDSDLAYYKEAHCIRFYWDAEFSKCCWQAKKFCTDKFWRPTREQQGSVGSEWLTAMPAFETKPGPLNAGNFEKEKDMKIVETARKLGGGTASERHLSEMMAAARVKEWEEWQEHQAARSSQVHEFKWPLPAAAPAEEKQNDDAPGVAPGAHRLDRQFVTHRN